MIAELKITDSRNDVNSTQGMCGESRNEYQTYPAAAYSINGNTVLNAGSEQVFPNGFPTDFSLLAVLRVSQQLVRVPLFSIFSSEGEEVLILMVGAEIALFYQDTEGNPEEDSLISFGVGINDKKWHRIGLSVKGDSVTLILDCNRQITRQLQREVNSKIATDGLILAGVQFSEDEGFFVGDIQLLMIANTPDEAYNMCTKYAPNCVGGGSNVIATLSATSSVGGDSGRRIESRISSSSTSSSSGVGPSATSYRTNTVNSTSGGNLFKIGSTGSQGQSGSGSSRDGNLGARGYASSGVGVAQSGASHTSAIGLGNYKEVHTEYSLL